MIEPMSTEARHGPHWFEPLGRMGVPHVQHGIMDVVRPDADGPEPDIMERFLGPE